MAILRKDLLTLVLVPILGAFGLAGCTSENPPLADGTCAVAEPSILDCGARQLSAGSLGLVGYSCTGTARPDGDPTYLEGVPQGLVCADRAGSDGSKGYCCTTAVTTCAFNPVARCEPNTYGYQCRGADRPEALNAAVSCNQGVRQDDLINYCCSGAPRKPGCTQSDSQGCSQDLTGWICPAGVLPTAQDLGANKSRADLYYHLCGIPKSNGQVDSYCCFTPAMVPVGGTCVQNLKAAGCAPGRFGIACYGPDTPEENYPRLTCPDPGVPGASAEGYPATVYCCEFKHQTATQ